MGMASAPGGATPQDPPAYGGATRPPIPPSPRRSVATGGQSSGMGGSRPPGPPGRLTGRAALLAVVVCAIALSLAYPVREYIAQRQQIDQLLAQQETMSAQVKALQEQDSSLSQTWYVEQQARDQLHMCFPDEQCYEVLSGQSPPAAKAAKPAVVDPWYSKLWASVQQANQEPSR
jgi:cell division protein FtsB